MLRGVNGITIGLIMVFLLQIVLSMMYGIDLTDREWYAFCPERIIDEMRGKVAGKQTISIEGMLSLFVSSFLHQNPWITQSPFSISQITINILTMFEIGTYIESKLGFAKFMSMTGFLVLVHGVMQLTIAFVMALITKDALGPNLSIHFHAVGYNGILVAYLVTYLRLCQDERVLMWGCSIYRCLAAPISLLVVTLLFPQCFCSHLAGLFLGVVYAYTCVHNHINHLMERCQRVDVDLVASSNNI